MFMTYVILASLVSPSLAFESRRQVSPAEREWLAETIEKLDKFLRKWEGETEDDDEWQPCTTLGAPPPHRARRAHTHTTVTAVTTVGGRDRGRRGVAAVRDARRDDGHIHAHTHTYTHVRRATR